MVVGIHAEFILKLHYNAMTRRCLQNKRWYKLVVRSVQSSHSDDKLWQSQIEFLSTYTNWRFLTLAVLPHKLNVTSGKYYSMLASEYVVLYRRCYFLARNCLRLVDANTQRLF